MSWDVIIVAIISFLANVIATYATNNKTMALLSYRLEELEKKQDKHNTVIERMYKAESDIKTAFTRIDELRHDIT